MTLLTLMILPFVVSLAACWLMIRIGPRDAPDGARKMQATAVPSAGGIGIFAGVLAAVALGLFQMPADAIVRLNDRMLTEGVYPLIAFVLLAATLGFADDKLGLPALPKLVVLTGGALAAAVFGTQIETIWLPFGAGDVALPRWLSVVGIAIWLLVITNAVNFMDGADGIAMGSSAIMLMALVLLMVPEGLYASHRDVPGAAMAAGLAAVCAIGGFLVWNLRGRLFAGDTGALGIGALLGVLGLVVADRSLVWLAPVLMLPFLVDVLMTLFWRARAGRPLLKAHRDHAYQLLLRAGWPHRRVAGLWWIFSAACAGMTLGGPVAGMVGLLPLDWHPADLAFAVFASLAFVGCGLWIWQRRTLGRSLAADGR